MYPCHLHSFPTRRSSDLLKLVLTNCCEQTFNCISIDGDTSTNDTVLLLASGRSGVRLERPSARKDFSDALLRVCQSDRKSTRLNSSHVESSYAVFCLKQK